MGPTTSPAGNDNRGQTAVDFLAGMTVLLISVGFVLGFIPGMFQPFDTATGANLVSADRAGANIVERLLVTDTENPGVLNDTCTAEFFDGDGDTADCRFETDSEDLNEALAIEETVEVNVTIESGDSIRTVDGVRTAAGQNPPETGEVVTSKRGVLLDSEDGIVYVRVW